MANSEAGEKEDLEVKVDIEDITDSTGVETKTQRSASDATVVYNDQFEAEEQKDEKTEALIQAAARDIIDKIEQDRHDKTHGPQSDLSGTEDNDTDQSFLEGSNLTYGTETDLSYQDGTEMSYGGEQKIYEGNPQRDSYDGSASSHLEDDVFSHGRTPSGGSNNSSDAQNADEEARYRLTKEITEEVERQQTALQHEDQPESPQEEGFFDQSCDEDEDEGATPMVSRVPSAATTTFKHTLNGNYLNPDVFRSPGSIRALQMSSPAPSVFSSASPMSRKRPTSSHRLNTLHTPTPTRSTRATPRFAAKEDPLVLLHVTVLPLRWSHGELIENAPNDVLSKELLAVKQSWKVLKDKLGDTVLQRGVLIPHPQDSFEMLDERLCAALELPHRPRAKILDCGHYVGPSALLVDEVSDEESFDSEDSESEDDDFRDPPDNTWCDVCEKDVHFGKMNKLNRLPRKKSFKVKVYASNGLMGSGAWNMSWREMEKVDVEIEPAVEPSFNMEIGELFDMAMATRQQQDEVYEEDQAMESPQIVVEEVQPEVVTHHEPVTPAPTYQEATRPSTAVTVNQEPAYMEARSLEASPPAPSSLRMLSPEPSAQPIIALPVESKIRHLEDEVRRIEMEEQRHREIYGNEERLSPSRSQWRQQQRQYEEEPRYQHSRSSSRMSNRSGRSEKRRERRQEKLHVDGDSFLELLLAAARVLLSDTKNLVIGFLGCLVVVFALRSGADHTGMAVMTGIPSQAQPSYETAFQRQEAALQRQQMENVVRMRVQAESMARRPAGEYQAQPPYNAVVKDVQSVVHDSQAPVYAQQEPAQPVVPAYQALAQQAQAPAAVPIQQAAIPAPPPVQQIAHEAKPSIPAAPPVNIGNSAGTDADRRAAGQNAFAQAVAKIVGEDVEGGFTIPTPPASLNEIVV